MTGPIGSVGRLPTVLALPFPETQPLLHIITFLQVPPSSQHIVTIKQMRVTSTAAEDAGGDAELSNPDAFTVIYIRGGE